MPGSVFGRMFRVATFGESHGRAVGVVVDGPPPGIALDESMIQRDLDRRRPGQSAITTPRRESDKVEILSGVFEGRTTGTPLAMIIFNHDSDPSAYEPFRHMFRPGHADFTYQMKYGMRDWRGSGRASGRETAARVAAGAVAKAFLARYGIRCRACAVEIGGVRAERLDWEEVERNPVRAPDAGAVPAMVRAIEEARAAEDSVGGVAELHIEGCPPGLGDPVFDKLDALLAAAIMSIGAVKAVEIGAGFAAARMAGSEFNDPFEMRDGRVQTMSNHCGGILGGISTGGDIVLRAAVRPPASIARKQQTVTVDGAPAEIEVHGRHDPCIVPRIVPVMEAMGALVIADCLLVQRGMHPGRLPENSTNHES